MTISESEFLYVDEIARICRAPKSSVRHWLRTGKLASIRPGKRRLIHRQDLAEFIAAGARGPVARRGEP